VFEKKKVMGISNNPLQILIEGGRKLSQKSRELKKTCFSQKTNPGRSKNGSAFK